jgi:hypothetical protein
MFESSFLLRLAKPALDGTIPLQPDYNDCWQVRLRARNHLPKPCLFNVAALLCRAYRGISNVPNEETSQEIQSPPKNTRPLKTPPSPAMLNFKSIQTRKMAAGRPPARLYISRYFLFPLSFFQIWLLFTCAVKHCWF